MSSPEGILPRPAVLQPCNLVQVGCQIAYICILRVHCVPACWKATYISPVTQAKNWQCVACDVQSCFISALLYEMRFSACRTQEHQPERSAHASTHVSSMHGRARMDIKAVCQVFALVEEQQAGMR